MTATIPSRLLALATTLAVLAVVLLAAHPVSAQTPGNDADLSSLSILGTGVPGFDADTTSYTISLDTPERPATIAAQVADANATVKYTPVDADTETDGHQVVLNEGESAVTVTVTAEDTTTTKNYTVTVTVLDAADRVATTAKAAVDDRTSASTIHYLGSIEEAGDVDWIRVELEADQMYRFALKGSYRSSERTLDVPMITGLYNGDGDYIDGTLAVGTVGFRDRADVRLHYMAEADGDYYLAVRGIEDQTGTYALRVLEVPDDVQPDNASTPGEIAVGGSMQGVIDYRGDVDWYKVESLESRTGYVMEVRAGSAGSPLPWPVVKVYDSDGELVPVNYLSQTPSQSRAAFIPASEGTHYVTARSGWNRSGGYTLSLSEDVSVVTVSFGQSSYEVDEGSSVTVTVSRGGDPERSVTIPISKTNQGGATAADYSGVPASVVFTSGQTEQTFSFTAAQDTENDDGESVALSFGTLPDRVTEVAPATATVSINDDDVPAVTVSFKQSSYEVDEGSSVTVTVSLSADPERSVTIPISKTNQGGATAADYSGVPASVVFASGQTEQTFSFSATADTEDEDEDGESVALGFGTLPVGVTTGSPNEATVSITDDDLSVRVTAADYGELSVGWSAPDSTGGTDVTAYDLRYILSAASDKADANWTVVDNAWESDPGGDLAYTIAGLTPGANYDVQVRAETGEDVGAWSVVRRRRSGNILGGSPRLGPATRHDRRGRELPAAGRDFPDPLGRMERPRPVRLVRSGEDRGGP